MVVSTGSGVAPLPGDGLDAQSLPGSAQTAMSIARRAGRNLHRFHEPFTIAAAMRLTAPTGPWILDRVCRRLNAWRDAQWGGSR